MQIDDVIGRRRRSGRVLDMDKDHILRYAGIVELDDLCKLGRHSRGLGGGCVEVQRCGKEKGDNKRRINRFHEHLPEPSGLLSTIPERGQKSSGVMVTRGRSAKFILVSAPKNLTGRDQATAGETAHRFES